MNKRVLCLALFYAMTPLHALPEKKPWTIMIAMAASNDLDIFAPRNLKQMESIGSNKNINIVAQIITIENRNTKKARTFFIDKGEKMLLHEKSNKVDSGDPENLIHFCLKTIEQYPAEKYGLILWNHGTGTIEPLTRSRISTAHLFALASKFKQTRKQHYLPLLEKILVKDNRKKKGVCFDDETGNFLTEQKLRYALQEVCKRGLGGEKIHLLGFDACFMSMIEVASSIKEYAHVMVGSQEVELGTGWNYARVFAPFLFGSISEKTLGIHIVNSYAKAYAKTNDYTQSALDLNLLEDLEDNVSSVAKTLTQMLKEQKSGTVRSAIQLSKNKYLCTHFDEPDFIDLHHFYTNLNENLEQINLQHKGTEEYLKKELALLLREGRNLIQNIVIANKTGSLLAQANGLSIYFPDHTIHSSYRKNTFTLKTSWDKLLSHYLFF